jgi:hypothetical protein
VLLSGLRVGLVSASPAIVTTGNRPNDETSMGRQNSGKAMKPIAKKNSRLSVGKKASANNLTCTSDEFTHAFFQSRSKTYENIQSAK